MLIIIDKETKVVLDNFGTNSMFPDGNMPINEKENEIYVRIQDDSEVAKKILSAYDYELVLNENNDVTDVIVHKTIEEYRAEQPPLIPPPTIEEQLAEKDKQISELKTKQVETNQMVAENGVMQQDLLELLIDMGVI